MSNIPGSAFENLRVEKHGRAAIITIARPQVLNALDVRTLAEIHTAVEACGLDPETRGIIITGEGRAFVAGADIAHLSQLGPIGARAFSEHGGRAFRTIESVGKPVIAAVNGFALGGGFELALACDFILASTKARFGQPEVNLGVIPGFGGTQRLSRLIGKNLARFLVYTGEIVDASWALQHQVAVEVLEPDALLPRALALVETIATRGPLAVASAKRVIQRGFDVSLEAAIDIEALAFGELFASKDQREGMAAFLSKRTPEFKGE